MNIVTNTLDDEFIVEYVIKWIQEFVEQLTDASVYHFNFHKEICSKNIAECKRFFLNFIIKF